MAATVAAFSPISSFSPSASSTPLQSSRKLNLLASIRCRTSTFYGVRLRSSIELSRESQPGRTSRQVIDKRGRKPLPVEMSLVVDKTGGKSLVTEEVDLPPLSLDGPLRGLLSDLGMKRLTTIPGILKSTRATKALLLYYPDRIDKSFKATGVPAVVFGHGFSQGPKNYMSTLEKFAEAGFVVIAPTTFLGVKEMLFSKIEGSGFLAKAPTKLQTALCTDLLRSVQHLFSDFSSTAKIGKVFLSGHSMGGGCSLIVASYLKESLVGSVGVMAPAVKGLLKSPVNPELHMDGRRRNFIAATKFFENEFPTCPLFILAGNDDRIVKPEESSFLFQAAYEAKEDEKLEDVTLYSIDGCHIGFEDALNADITAKSNLIDKVIFPIINFLVYKMEAIKGITKDMKAQKCVSQEILVGVFREALATKGGPTGLSADELAGFAREFETGEIKKRKDPKNMTRLFKSERDSLGKVGDAVADAAIALSDADLKDQKEVSPIPATAALAGYAIADALTLLVSLQLLNDHPSIGLAGLAALASSLVYDNVTIAIGRQFGYLDDGEFIPEERGRALALLNAPRFFFHSFTPLLTVTGFGLASRAGISWAESLPVQGAISLGIGAVCLVSLVRNTLLLEVRPKYTAGLLHYTYDDPGLDFTRIVPSLVASAVLTVLGFLSFRENSSLLPFFAGPLISIILNAIPSEKDNPASLKNKVILGNLAEVILLVSLVASEALLQSQGL